jgi:hypothetical protein
MARRTRPTAAAESFVADIEFFAITEFVNFAGQLLRVPVPEPSSMVLTAIGLLGLAAWGCRRRR